MITALDVANTFLKYAKDENISITPMKLQKLIYILYKEYLKETKTKLIAEKFEVWQYGPVIKEVYDAFKKYRFNPITDFYCYKDNTYSTMKLSPNSQILDIFSRVWSKYKEFDGIYLSELTHQPKTAWSVARDKRNPVLNDSDIIKETSYYEL